MEKWPQDDQRHAKRLFMCYTEECYKSSLKPLILIQQVLKCVGAYLIALGTDQLLEPKTILGLDSSYTTILF